MISLRSRVRGDVRCGTEGQDIHGRTFAKVPRYMKIGNDFTVMILDELCANDIPITGNDGGC